MIDKKYNIKVYDKTGLTFLKTINPEIVKVAPSFSSQLKGGYGECRLDLALPFSNFDEGSVIDFMNVVEIYQTDLNNPKGRLIYRGFISSYEPYIAGSNQGVNVILLGMVSLLKFAYYKNGASFSVAHNLQDTAAIMKAIIDHFISVYGAGLIKYDAASVANVGNSSTYTFDEDTWWDALQNGFGTIGSGNWWWAIDKEGKFFLQQKPASATHTFTIEKDVESLRLLKNSEKITNAVRVKYSNTTYDKQDNPSIGEFGRREKIISDNRVIDLATATNRATQEIETNKIIKVQASLIINSKYDIESVKVGDTCKILNLPSGTTSLDDNMQIVSVQYSSDRINVQLEEINDKFGIELGKFVSSP